MRCPFCNFEDTKVIDSRPSDEKKRRRRECTNCGKRFTTYEVIEKPTLMVYKRDGSFEPFDRDKLVKGIRSALKKRPISVEQVNKMVDEIENTYANAMQTETTTSEIGPTLPRYMAAIMMSFPHTFRRGVRPLVSPTVAVALTVS